MHLASSATILAYFFPSFKFQIWGIAVTWGHKAVAFGKSRVMLGSISNVDRARVNALQNPDDDRPLAAHFRVSWFNIAAIFIILGWI